MSKWISIGINSTLVDWIDDFLNKRTFLIVEDDVFSNKFQFKTDVGFNVKYTFSIGFSIKEYRVIDLLDLRLYYLY